MIEWVLSQDCFVIYNRLSITAKGVTMTAPCCQFTRPLALALSCFSLILTATAAEKPVKVYILSGQSNMVGIGQVTGGGSRWGSEFSDPVLSVYEGKYDPKIDYDKLEPTKTLKLTSFGGVTPTPYLGGGTQIVRGFIQIKATGIYELRPGYGGSTFNIMEVDGQEVYRKEPGKDALHKQIKLTPDKKVPFKITYLTAQANGLGWIARIDIPGTSRTGLTGSARRRTAGGTSTG